MKNFMIKILKSKLSTYWYSEHIGETFLAVGVSKGALDDANDFIVKRDGDRESYLVDWNDCELVFE
jgi:hypothetical protein